MKLCGRAGLQSVDLEAWFRFALLKPASSFSRAGFFGRLPSRYRGREWAGSGLTIRVKRLPISQPKTNIDRQVLSPQSRHTKSPAHLPTCQPLDWTVAGADAGDRLLIGDKLGLDSVISAIPGVYHWDTLEQLSHVQSWFTRGPIPAELRLHRLRRLPACH